MKIISKLILWGLRIFIFLSYPGAGGALVVFEIIASALGLLRLEQDQIFENITGFVGDSNVGYYSVKDNGGQRLFGWLAWLVAMGLRFILVATLFGYDPQSLFSSEPTLFAIINFFN
jgi:hypothetical protein